MIKYPRLFSILYWWMLLLLITSYMLEYYNPPEKTKKTIFLILLPTTFVITFILYNISLKIYSKKFNGLEKTAIELNKYIAKEKNVDAKNDLLLSLANVYLLMVEEHKALDTLNQIDKRVLFLPSPSKEKRKSQCMYYNFLLSCFDNLDGNQNVIKVYNEAYPLFNEFYNNKKDQIIFKLITFYYEKALRNYDKALEIIEYCASISNETLKPFIMLDVADMYIRTGKIDNAVSILNSFNPKPESESFNIYYNRCLKKLKLINRQ